tara:strand:- start:273 stop:1100 length:828 start_codon:yes stop_codon:yes gene_type:complete
VKSRHNKKRNTALIYEALARHLTKSIIAKNVEAKDKIISIIKEHFHKDTVMAKELELYRVLCETYDLKPHMAEKMIFEIRKLHESLDKKQLFTEQTDIIKKINQSFGKSFFSSFVPNYKTLATISQVFNMEVPTKKRLVLEESLVEKLTSAEKNTQNLKSVDNLTFKTFTNKFNSEYSKELFKEQAELLSKYITSFVDNGLDLKVFLHEEISRLKDVVSESLDLSEIKEDPTMVEKTKKVLAMLNEFRSEKVEKALVEKVLKIQSLAREVITDGN